MQTSNKKEVRQLGIDGDVVENIVLLDPNEVFVPENRFRKLNEKFVKQLAESINKSGQLQIIRVDKNGNLIDGNHRLEACRLLKIKVKAEIVDSYDNDILELEEIDTNLVRNELTVREKEDHLAERKRLYEKLFPETKQGGAGKGGNDVKSFTEDTAEKLNVSKKTVERAVKRAENASEEVKDARDNKEISSADMDAIIKDTEGDKDKQKLALQEKIKAKREAKLAKEQQAEEQQVEETTEAVSTPKVEENETHEECECDKLQESLTKALEKIAELEAKIEKQAELLTKKEKSIDRYKGRIAKAKAENPEIKI